MKQIAVLAFLLSACATSVPFPDPAEPAFVGPMQTRIMEVETETVATAQAVLPTATFEFEPQPQRTNWLLLGGDYRAHREGTGYGNKTDVIVLVSILETDPIDIAVVQFPRNLYVPVEGMDDQWLFGVWGREGWQGLHQYFQRVFGVSLQGIHYTNMDSFVQIIDEMDGVNIVLGTHSWEGGEVVGLIENASGAETLTYLRDNENNWERGTYDAEQRVFKVLAALWGRGSTFLLEDPAAAANIVYSQWGDLFQTDLANLEQLYWLFTLGWKVKNNEYEIRWIQLEEPYIVRGDTPILQDEKPIRGMIPDPADIPDLLKAWMRECVFDQRCEADT